MLCNLWHIKQTNGLFYYALDYIHAVQPPMEVVVRPELLAAAARALPGHAVQAMDGRQLIRRLWQARRRGEWVFTPTSHPFPLSRRQVVVVHDDFPFLGRMGRLKRTLFRSAIRLSGCCVGHINHSTALRAVPTDLVRGDRLWYVPNLGPEDAAIHRVGEAHRQHHAARSAAAPFSVALFGSDSRKKRYEVLFAEVMARDAAEAFRFLIYGHETDYYRELKAQFPALRIELVRSGLSLEDFLGSVDAVASVALHEGFGRPIALALAAQIPAFLVDAEVFREFFGSSTPLHASVGKLVDALMKAAGEAAGEAASMAAGPPATMQAGGLAELPQIRQAFSAAIRRLESMAQASHPA